MASVDKRSPQEVNYAKLPNPGPFLARIVNNADPMKMGSLEVELLRPVGNFKDAGQQLFTVKYLSPFYGVTGIEHNGTNANEFNDTQKSYGFWAVPPDVGVTVMVIFVESDPGQGFWIGCVQDTFMNHMIPGIAASHSTQPQSRDHDDTSWKNMASTEQLYGDTCLPCGEINRMEFKGSDRAPNPNPDVDSNKKPVHPIAKWLYEQGTLHDPVRGIYTSSARRESPSNVYGWSTPGPRDKRSGAKKGKIGRREGKIDTFVSRMGGFCIVMDDGDERYLRKTRPWEGPSEYADLEKGEQGLVDWPRDEAFRIRTRKGAQILMHCSEDLIFICNSRGTAWMEMTSRGAINFHAAEGVHFGTDGDISMSAGRDVIQNSTRDIVHNSGAQIIAEAGNRISMASQTHVHLSALAGDIGMAAAQSIAFQSDSNLNLQSANINFGGANHEWTVGGNLVITCSGNLELRGNNTFLTSDSETHLVSGSGMLMLSRSLNVAVGSSAIIDAGEGISLHTPGALIANGEALLSLNSSGGPSVLAAQSGVNIKTDGYINASGKGSISLLTEGAANTTAKSVGIGASGDIVQKGANIHLNGPDAPAASPASGPSVHPDVRKAVEAHHAGGSAPGYQQAGGPYAGLIQKAAFNHEEMPSSVAKVIPGRDMDRTSEHRAPEKINMHTNDIQNPTQNTANVNEGGTYVQDASSVHQNPDVKDSIGFGGGSGCALSNTQGSGGSGGLEGGHAGWASLRSGRDAMHNLEQSNDGSPTDQYGTPSTIRGSWTKDQEFLSKTAEVAGTIGITRNELLGIFMIESSCNPQAGAGKSHVGLIQWGKKEAADCGTSQGELLRMSRVQQLEFVKKYFQNVMKGGKADSVGQAYCYIALPAFAKQPYTQPLCTGQPGSKYYSYWKANPLWRDKQIPGQPITRRGIDNAVKRRVRDVEATLGGGGGAGSSTGGTPASSTPNPGSGTNPTRTA